MAKWKEDPQGRNFVDEVTEVMELPIYKADADGEFRPWLKESFGKIEDKVVKVGNDKYDKTGGVIGGDVFIENSKSGLDFDMKNEIAWARGIGVSSNKLGERYCQFGFLSQADGFKYAYVGKYNDPWTKFESNGKLTTKGDVIIAGYKALTTLDLNAINKELGKKQDKTDDSLNTSDKRVVGGINELKRIIDSATVNYISEIDTEKCLHSGLYNLGSKGQNSPTDTYAFLEVKRERTNNEGTTIQTLYETLNPSNRWERAIHQNGTVYHWVKMANENDLKLKQDKTDNNLQTVNKTVVGAINGLVNDLRKAENDLNNKIEINGVKRNLIIESGSFSQQSQIQTIYFKNAFPNKCIHVGLIDTSEPGGAQLLALNGLPSTTSFIALCDYGRAGGVFYIAIGY